MDQIELGKKIQELRKRKGLTQEDLADKTGISTRTIQRIENGEVDARTYTLNKLAEALDVAINELLEEHSESVNLKKDNKKWLAILHLSGLFIMIIPPLILWIIKKDDVQNIETHAKDVMNFQLSMLIYLLGATVLMFLIIGFPILIFLALFSTVIIIINTMKVLQGVEYKYPLTLNILKKM